MNLPNMSLVLSFSSLRHLNKLFFFHFAEKVKKTKKRQVREIPCLNLSINPWISHEVRSYMMVLIVSCSFHQIGDLTVKNTSYPQGQFYLTK